MQVPGSADRAAEDLQGAPLLDPLGEGVQGIEGHHSRLITILEESSSIGTPCWILLEKEFKVYGR